MFKKVCVIGEGLTSLIVTRMLLELDLKVDLISENYHKKKNHSNRALAISQSNIKYLDYLNIFEGKRNYKWNVYEISLFSVKENYNKNKIFNFNNKTKPLFIMIKNHDLHLILKEKLKNSSLLQIYSQKKARIVMRKIITNKNKYAESQYGLILNCDSRNILNKKFFSKQIKKKYPATAVISTLRHKKICNNVASQFFMPQGPLAFLPLSNDATSVVWSIKNNYLSSNKKENDNFFKNEIKKVTNNHLKEINFSRINEYDLNFLISREYYHKNILNFGEGLHQIHPLAGQGLNMVIRDIKTLSGILKRNIELGLDLTPVLLKDFSEASKSYNFLFAKSIDLAEKYFSIKNELFSKLSDKLIKSVNKNFFLKDFLVNVADKGIDRLNY